MSQRPSVFSTLRSPRVSMFAAACLLAGWVHVWLHYAESGDAGHFEAEVAAECGLADTPPAIDCRAPRPNWQSVSMGLAGAAADLAPRGRPIGIASIRAPPTV